MGTLQSFIDLVIRLTVDQMHVQQALADKKKHVSDDDILALVGDELHQPQKLWELIDLQVATPLSSFQSANQHCCRWGTSAGWDASAECSSCPAV